MSNTIEQRVVEMRFDNKNFENNVKTSMSTIDRLKQKLNFGGASKSLESISDAAKKVNMSGLSGAVETVQAKFSALQVAGVTALANITNSAINTGKQLVSALTIDPVISGFQEYETQMNAIQTILANTSHAGTTLDDVTNALGELNTYADQTIYNFTEMTRNIGTFTAAGVDLDTSVGAIKGIANLAAISGSNAEQASMAMYQLSQALAAGRVSLEDWNSVVSAGMGGKIFQDALMNTAEAMGIAVDRSVSFRQSLSTAGGKQPWLTSEVLLNTLNEFTGDLTDAELAAMGFTEAQIKNIQDMAKTAQSAATDVKTLTQLWDTMKEAAGSGWAQTWTIIFGDFEEAKELWSGVAEFFTGDNGIITKMSTARNTLLEGALKGNPFSGLVGHIEEITTASEKAATSTEKVTSVTKDYGTVVEKIIRGDFGNAPERFEKLSEAGYDYAHAQNLVNEKLGDSTRRATDYKEIQEDLNKTQKTVNETRKITIDDIVKMSDAQLKSIGFTQEEVESFRGLEKQSEKTGIPLKSLIEDIDQLNGRTLLLKSFENIGTSLVKIFTAVGDAWRQAFYGDATEEEIMQQKTERLYNIIAAIHKFTTNLVVSDETAEKLTRTLKGVFAIFDIITSLLGGGFKIAFKAVTTILGAFDMDILDVTANVGDVIVAFRDWLFEGNALADGIQKLAGYLKDGVQTVRGWIDEFKNLPIVKENLSKLQSAFFETFGNLNEHFSEGLERLREFIDRVKQMDGITLDNIGDVLKDFKDNVFDYFFDLGGIFDNLWKTIGDFRDNVVNYFTDVGDSAGTLAERIKEFVIGIRDAFNEHVGVGELLTIGIGAAIILFVKKIGDALELISGPLEDFSEAFEGLGKVLNAYAMSIKAEALFTIAKAIVALAAAVAVLSLLDQAKMWSAIGALSLLAAELVAISWAMGKFNSTLGSAGSSLSLVALAGSVLILAAALKVMDGLNEENILRNLGIIAALAAGLAAVAGALGKFAPTLSSGSVTLIALAVSLKILISALADLETIDMNNIGESLVLVLVAMRTMALIANACKNVNIGAAATILAMVVALKMLIGMFDDIAAIDMNAIYNNLDALVLVFASLSALMLASRFGGNGTAKAGIGILAMAASLVVIVQACKMMDQLDPTAIRKASDTISGLLLVFGALTVLSKFSGENATKAGLMVLAMSGAILIISAAMVVLSKLDPAGLDQALGAILALQVVFGALIAVSKLAGDSTSTLVILGVTIGLLAVALGALSMIDPAKLGPATAALSIVIGTFSLLVASTNLAKKANGTLIIMTTVVAALAGILVLLSGLPAESALAASASLSLLLTSLSASMLIVSKADNVTTSAYATLGVMTLVVGGLAAIIGIMAAMQVGPTLEIAASLSLLLTSLSASMLIISKADKISASAYIALGSMTLVVGGLAAIIGVLASFNVGSTLEVASSLSLLLTSLSASILIISKADKVSASAMVALPVMTLVVAGLATIIGTLASMNVGPTLEIAESLSLLLISMSAATAVLSAIGKFLGGGAALQGVAGLAAVVAGVGAILVAIGALNTYWPQALDFIESGIPMLEAIGQGLGAFFGGIVGGFSSGVVSGLPDMGKKLGEFMNNADPFIEGAKEIDSTVMDGVKNLAATVLTLTAANILDGIAQFFGMGSTLTKFGEQLKPFGESLAEFGQAIKGKIDPESTEAAANAGLMLAELNKSLPRQGGALQEFLGTQDLSVFSTQLKSFGEAIVEFSATVSGGKVNEEAVTAAANSGKALAELNNTLPRQGGVLQEWLGSQDLSIFGEQLVVFGRAIVGFSETVSNGKVDEEAVIAAANSGKALAELNNNLPRQGGSLQSFLGSQDLSVFGIQLKSFGQAIADFSSTVSNGKVNEEAVTSATNAGRTLTELYTNLPKQNGMMQNIFGSQDMTAFGEDLVGFGRYFAEYSGYMENVKSETVTATSNAAKSLVELQNSLPEEGGWFSSDTYLSDFGKQIASFGQNFRGYYDYISTIDTYQLYSTTMEVERLVAMAKGMADLDTSGMTSFASSLATLANGGIDSFIAAFQNANSRVSQAAVNMLTTFINSTNSKRSEVVSTYNSILAEALSAMNSHSMEFNSSGQTLMTQFVAGIRARENDARSTLANIIAVLLTSIKNKYTEFQTVGQTTMTRFLAGITSRTSTIKSGIQSILTMGVSTIRAEQSKFYDAGSYLMERMKNGATSKKDGIKTEFARMLDEVVKTVRGYNEQFENAGKYLGEGFAEGIASSIEKAKEEAEEMVKETHKITITELNAHSPSRLFMEIGSYVPLGFAKGISSETKEVQKSSSSMARSAIQNVQDALSKAVEVLNSDMDTQPTIKPVLDLTNVETGARKLNSMFTRTQAMSIDASMNRRTAETIQNGETVSPSGNSYTFQQYNYSPKALSRVEIYRQTKNQFSALERMVEA